MAVTGAAMSGAPEDGHRDAEDGLTHAPTMGRARERRESGWRRFEAMEEESGGGRKGSISSRSSREVPYIPDNRNSDMLPPPGMSVGMSLGTGTSMSMQSMRTEHSSAPLIAKPRPALVARTSSVYSTGSAVPAYGQEPGHGHGHGYAYA
ncbi:hypothetical protein C8R44DRAFT_783983 [Mycena epipterygia]|nr:hypothetical protein C8R44DRAFT_783983 [Mycena epipterygia]